MISSHSLHKEILKIESQLTKLRDLIEDKLLESLNSEDDEGGDFWHKQVRRRVLEGK